MTNALCRIGEAAFPAVRQELERRVVAGKIAAGDAAQLADLGLRMLRLLCPVDDQARIDRAQRLGFDLAVSDGMVYVVGGAQDDSTMPEDGAAPNGRRPGTVECAGGWCEVNGGKKGKKGCGCRGCSGGGVDLEDLPGFCNFFDKPANVEPSFVPMSGPGDWNCRRWSSRLAACQIESIARRKRRYIATGATDLGTLVQVVWPTLEAPPGYAYYRLVVSAIGVSHYNCVRSVEVKNRARQAIIPEEIAIQAERLVSLPNNTNALAWKDPKPEDPAYIKITDGRCECAKLCDCTPEEGRVAILLLLPLLPDGDRYTATVKGMRDRWCVICGPCPVEPICEMEPVDNCLPCACDQAPPQAPPVPLQAPVESPAPLPQ